MKPIVPDPVEHNNNTVNHADQLLFIMDVNLMFNPTEQEAFAGFE